MILHFSKKKNVTITSIKSDKIGPGQCNKNIEDVTEHFFSENRLPYHVGNTFLTIKGLVEN